MSSGRSFLVVGSGPTGAMAAQTLVEAGENVTLYDVGARGTQVANVPEGDFHQLRTSDPDQHAYFLGNEFEGVDLRKTGSGAQLTPARKHLVWGVNRLTPFFSNSFFPTESLAYGGLGAGWGLGCCAFSTEEMAQAGLHPQKMRKAYQTVSNRIGISGAQDDASPFTHNNLAGIQQAEAPDPNHLAILDRYGQKKSKLNKSGFYLGRPALALLTENRQDRKASAQDDMDFYSDASRSAWRAWMTIDALRKHENFTYQPNRLVVKIETNRSQSIVHWQNTNSGDFFQDTFDVVLLAAGVLGTGRIVLRSLGNTDSKLPILSNHYTYLPCLQWSRLGKADNRPRHSMAQLSLFHDVGGTQTDVAMASLYSYRSLLLFRVIKENPIAYRYARELMQYLVPAMSIAGIHFPEKWSKDKFMWLQRSSNNNGLASLHVDFKRTSTEWNRIRKREKQFTRAFRQLGLFPLSKVDPGNGSSIHYAGSLPFSEKKEGISLQMNGQLNGIENVFVADASGFKYLPAKGITFSAMAYAHIVAENAIKTAQP